MFYFRYVLLPCESFRENRKQRCATPEKKEKVFVIVIKYGRQVSNTARGGKKRAQVNCSW